MNLQIVGRRTTVTAALRQHVEQRLERLARFLDGAEKVHVVLGVERFLQTAEGEVSTRRGLVQAKAATNDMYASIDALSHKLLLQIRKRKERSESRKTSRLKEFPGPGESVPSEEDEIVRVPVPTLTRARALASFQRSKGPVLVFRDASSRRIRIICREDGGDVRILDPDLDRLA